MYTLDRPYLRWSVPGTCCPTLSPVPSPRLVCTRCCERPRLPSFTHEPCPCRCTASWRSHAGPENWALAPGVTPCPICRAACRLRCVCGVRRACVRLVHYRVCGSRSGTRRSHGHGMCLHCVHTVGKRSHDWWGPDVDRHGEGGERRKPDEPRYRLLRCRSFASDRGCAGASMCWRLQQGVKLHPQRYRLRGGTSPYLLLGRQA